MSGRRGPQIAAVLLLLSGLGCSEANLYSPTAAREDANRLALGGRVCTEDPVQARFPLRVVLLVDQAAGPLFSDVDPAGKRFTVMNAFVQSILANPQAEMAILGFAGRTRKYAPTEGDFTRNPGELMNGVNNLALAQPCLSLEQCRDYREGMRSAQAIIEGDLASMSVGARVLTTYVVMLITAGPHAPLARAQDCCERSDVACIDGGDSPSQACEGLLEAADVTVMRDAIADLGGAGLRFHVLRLGTEGSAEAEAALTDAGRAMAFAGSGTYQQFVAADGLSLAAFDLVNLRTVLFAKLLMAANLNAKAGPKGPVLDSDADGLSDEEESSVGTNSRARDTDSDGITDYVEVLTGFDPNVLDTPSACTALKPGADRDLDNLTDCDEALIGTERSLVDSDGDGMPDYLELVHATDYVHGDAEADADGDGVSNGDEIRAHTDPRSSDARFHLSNGYRYEIADEGFVRELFASRLERLTGVEIGAISGGTTPGVGAMVWEPGAGTLAWRDASDTLPGIPVAIRDGGAFLLGSSSWAEIQEDSGRYVMAHVVPSELGPDPVTEQVRVVYRDRQCLSYRIRNLQLMATKELDDGTPAGYNNIVLYFAEAPENDLAVPGPFRMAQIPVIFDPPSTRIPNDLLLQVADEEFVRPKGLVD